MTSTEAATRAAPPAAAEGEETGKSPINLGALYEELPAAAAVAPDVVAEEARATKQVFSEIKRIIVGQDRLIERLLVALLARGHILLEGVPGLAKTLAIKTVGQVVGASFRRIQF